MVGKKKFKLWLTILKSILDFLIVHLEPSRQ